MGSNGLFNHTISLLERSLDLRMRRHDAIASNVANIDTPNYKAFDVMVEEELQKMDRASENGQAIRLKTTQGNHIESRLRETVPAVSHAEVKSDNALQRRDGNRVDLDREMAAMAENQLMYTLSAQVVAKKFQALRNIIQGGNK
jgi:flagellar basal-body rod protein FlgB